MPLDILFWGLVYSKQRSFRSQYEIPPGASFCKYKEVMLMSTYELKSITGEVSA
jgi:hypothetical protein